MKKYISAYGNENPLAQDVLVLDEKPPEVPHYLIEIKILRHERAFIHNRPLAPFRVRIKKAFLEAVKTFREKIAQ